MKNFIGLITLTSSFMLQAASTQMDFEIIHGEDDRKEIYESSQQQQKLAKATAGMANKKSLITIDKNHKMLNPSTLKRDWDLCEGQKFAGQKSAVTCSGFLIAPDLLVTAGHCVTNEDDCAEVSWVFDYRINEETKKAKTVVNNSKIYNCKKIISAKLRTSDMMDYSLIQLDRDVTDRKPLKFRTSGKIQKGEGITVIGHPSGLPTKVAGGAKVLINGDKTFFKGNLDTFGGNSGSAVFNDTSNEIEGILVRGEKDYAFNETKKCYAVNKLDDQAGKEAVTRITMIPELMNIDKLLNGVVKNNIEKVVDAVLTGMNVNMYDRNKDTALIKAAKMGRRTKIVKALIKANANVNQQNKQGKTALHYAAQGNKFNTARILIANGASVLIKDASGKTPLNYIKVPFTKMKTIISEATKSERTK